MQQPELTFEDVILTLTLTDSQRRQLEPLVRRQATDRRALIFVSVGPFIDDNGQTAFRLQAKFLPWRHANKVLKIIREADAKNSD
jgi:hypothetical protein